MKLENIYIVLVEPIYAGNIGAVARAMKNMGLERLALVNPGAAIDLEAYRMSAGADDILRAAPVYPSLREALAETNLAIATTARSGKRRRRTLTPRHMAAKLSDLTEVNRVAVVFGPEDRGLKNEDLALCQWLVTIPANPRFNSLNLAQAVMIVCYELWLASAQAPEEAPLQLASINRLEAMYDHLEATLLRIGFLHQNNPERMMYSLRRIFGRAGLEERDVRIIRGICRQLDWYVTARAVDVSQQTPSRSYHDE